jgi:hypothetical protein
MSLIGTKPNQLVITGMLGTMAWQDASAVNIGGGRATLQLHRTPIAKTAAFTVGQGESSYVVTGTASVAVTLPDVAVNIGREILITNRAAFTVVSNASNVVPRAGGAAGTAVLAATAGAWALLASDGSVWQIMAGS